jgi:hypothetical protein
LQDCTGARAAMRSAVAQARILAEYLDDVDAGALDLRFVDNHIRSLLQFASSARSQAVSGYEHQGWSNPEIQVGMGR